MDKISNDFFQEFIDHVKIRYGTRPVDSRVVYQEYIQHNYGINVRFTKWLTLTSFVKWLKEDR